MKYAQTWHTSLMKRGEGKEWRVDCCSILQQQLHTLQATSCTGVTQRRATINVTSFHLDVTKAWFSQKKTNWWNRIFVLTIFCRTYSVLPVHQHPAAAWHTGPVHVCTPHAAGWWSPPPRCLRLHHPQSAAAAGGPCPVQLPHALLSGLSRSQDHGLEECKAKSYKYMVIYDNLDFIFISTQCQTVVSIYLVSDAQIWSKLSETFFKNGTLCTLELAGLTSLHLLLSSHPTIRHFKKRSSLRRPGHTDEKSFLSYLGKTRGTNKGLFWLSTQSKHSNPVCPDTLARGTLSYLPISPYKDGLVRVISITFLVFFSSRYRKACHLFKAKY